MTVGLLVAEGEQQPKLQQQSEKVMPMRKHLKATFFLLASKELLTVGVAF